MINVYKITNDGHALNNYCFFFLLSLETRAGSLHTPGGQVQFPRVSVCVRKDRLLVFQVRVRHITDAFDVNLLTKNPIRKRTNLYNETKNKSNETTIRVFEKLL